MNTKRPRSTGALWAALLLALIAGLWHGASARPGHPWSGLDDFSAYLLHGRNLLEGRPYAAIDSVVDPGLPQAGLRQAFPPVYPALLALLEATPPEDADPRRYAIGLDVLHFKRINAALFGLSLFLGFLVFRRLLGDGLAILQLGLLGSLPFLFHFREFVRSELFFVVLLMSYFLALARFDEAPAGERRRWLLALLAGLLGGLAYATRTAAMVLPLALLTHEIWIHRKPRAGVLLAVGLTGALMLVVRLVFPEITAGYASHADGRLGLSTVMENAQHYVWDLQRILGRGLPEPLPLVILGGLAALALLGLLTRLRAPSLPVVFAAGTFAMHLILPTESAWMRYLIPLFAIFYLLVLLGAASLGALLRRPRLTPWTVGVVSIALGLPGLLSLPGGATPLGDGPTTEVSLEALEWIRTRTAPDDVVVFRKPWALNLATGRRSHVYPQRHVYPELSFAEHLAHLERTGARWLLLRHRARGESGPYKTLDYDDRAYLEEVVGARPELFRERARNADYVLLERVAGGG